MESVVTFFALRQEQGHAYDGPLRGRARHFEASTENLDALTHANEPRMLAGLRGLGIESLSGVRDLDYQLASGTGHRYALIVSAAVGAAWADKRYEHHQPAATAFDSPGRESEVTRTVEMRASDDIRFRSETLDIKRGETLKFVVINEGKTAREFSIGGRDAQKAHAAMMKSMVGMHHEDSETTDLVEPGKTMTPAWKFDKQPAAPGNCLPSARGTMKRG